MAAGDYSAAASYANVIAAYDSLFDPSVIEKDEQACITTAQNVLPFQGSRLREEYNALGKCIGRTVYWDNFGSFDADYSGTSFDGDQTCLVPAGTEGEAYNKTYDANVFNRKTTRWNDQDCDNEYQGSMMSARRINDAMRACRKDLCSKVATFLQTNAQANAWGDTPGTVVGTKTQFNAAEFNMNLVHTMRLIAIKNETANYRFLNGTNFWEIAQAAQFGVADQNVGDRNVLANFPMAWDVWLDDALNGFYTFIFDPSRIAFTNVTKYQNLEPELKHNGTNGEQIYTWRMPDPVLQWRSIDANGNIALTPVYYDIEYSKKCAGRSTRGEFLYTHDFAVYFEGMLDVAPNYENAGATRILQFQKV